MANSKFYIIPAIRSVTAGMKESRSYFLCPLNTVMTGRFHKGDENGQTQYEYATLKAMNAFGNPVAGIITIEDVRWESPIKESSGSGYDAPANRVIVGRQHSGDENGQTQYATAIIKIDGMETTLEEGINSSSIKESSGIWFKTDSNHVLTGRHHSGDENGQTYYTSAKVAVIATATTPAPQGTIIVPDVRTESTYMKESKSSFMCPSGTVMTGRSHIDDENGNTQYEYSTLKAINPHGEIVVGNITIEDIQWDSEFSESSGMGYDAPVNRVIVGRQHIGDENGKTKYATAIVKFNGNPTEIKDYSISETRKESGGWNWFKTTEQKVLTGRHHFGDENGNTYYSFGVISCDITPHPQNKFEIVIALHPNEKYYPMNPMDFITLSRFRKHHEGASDDGYNKETNSFVNGNSHDANYYNIPVDIINTFHLTDSEALYNLRPRDKASIGHDEVFLQPDNYLNGNLNPNGIVPVFTYSSYYNDLSNKVIERREFWIFYGYDEARAVGISFSHQGDWERIILDICDEKIQGAWLSQHTDLIYYPANQLQITESHGIQKLIVYSAIGSHAHYPNAGDFQHDETKANGYNWIITDKIKDLSTQPWILFAGAWGEVGADVTAMQNATTGPLGPWYKRFDFGRQFDNNILVSNLISDKQLLLIADLNIISDEKKESDGFMFEAPKDMLITGRRHSGDENGISIYQYSTLKAIDIYGNPVNGSIIIVDRTWSDWHQESTSDKFFQAPTGRVITGRQHVGDENGKTRYQTGVILFNGKPVNVINTSQFLSSISLVESGEYFFIAASHFIITGRTHSGDENGKTTYYQGYIICNK